MIADSTWGDLGEGSFVQDPQLQLWRVDRMYDGWYLLTSRASEQRCVQVHAATPCQAYVLSRIEAEALLAKVLGAVVITETENGERTSHDLPPLDYAAREWGLMEERGAQQTLAARWERPHMRTSGTGALAALRSHISMMHGYPRTEDFASIKQAVEAHDWMHAHPDYLIPFPHHHAPAPAPLASPDWISA